MAIIRATNNPDMLIWARKEIGLSLEQAAAAIGVSVDNLGLAEISDNDCIYNAVRIILV